MTRFTEVPAWKAFDGNWDEKRPYWTGSKEPPAIGTCVQLKLNGWEGLLGTVVAFCTDGGYIGLWVKPESFPSWHKEPKIEQYFTAREVSY